MKWRNVRFAAMVAFLLMAGGFMSRGCASPNTFEADTWASTKETRRLAMAEDLVRRDLLSSMNESQVLDLLGSPQFGGELDDGSVWYTYGLGGNPISRFLQQSSFYLSITIENDTVTSVEISDEFD